VDLIAELRRRNVLRMAGLYLVGAWLITQVAGTLLPMFEAPPWIARAIVVLLAIGFVPTMVFSWLFELTPQGFKRDADVPVSASIGPQTARRLNRAFIVALLLALGYFVFDKFVLAPRREDAIARQATVAAEATASSQPAGARAAATAPVPRKSIAVLPFENLSVDKANGYFADGIQDQILTSLAKIGDLKVISRTSTERYASRPENLIEVARQLAVAHILEGSVQRAGDRVRVNVQLIDATSDNHLWAETYDRTLDDIFVVQSEVAQKIAESLAAHMTHGELAALKEKPTDNALAYNAYLKARALDSSINTSRTTTEPILDAYREATKIDPGFALAWTGFANAAFRTWWTGLDPSGTLRDEGHRALDKATALAPQLAQVTLARGVYLYYVDRDYKRAYAMIDGLKSKLPGDVDVWMYSALLARRLGEWDRSIDDFTRARALAPNDAQLGFHLGVSLMKAQRYAEALPQFDASLASKGDNGNAPSVKVMCLLLLGDLERAGRTLDENQAATPLWRALKGQHALFSHDYASASRWLREAIDSDDGTQVDISFNGYIPTTIDWHLLLALSKDRAGFHDEAAAIYAQVESEARQHLAAPTDNSNIKAGWRTALSQALAGLGKADAAAHEGEAAVAMVSATEDRLDNPTWQYYLARAYALSGYAAKAAPLSERLLTTNAAWLTVDWLQMDPAWDPVRNDPAFQAVLRKADAAAASKPGPEAPAPERKP
jgi:TolB-like protein/Tfp pilus assembly protein PilF